MLDKLINFNYCLSSWRLEVRDGAGFSKEVESCLSFHLSKKTQLHTEFIPVRESSDSLLSEVVLRAALPTDGESELMRVRLFT